MCARAGPTPAKLSYSADMEAIIGFILRDRDRAGDLARAVIFAGGFLLIAGAVRNVVMKAFSAPSVLAGKTAPTGLSDIYLDLPLFWVPEGPLGYVVASVLLIAGIWFATLVRRLSQY